MPNNKVGVTTVGTVRQRGGNVISCPTKNNPKHATLNGITPEKGEELFNPVRPNPSKE